MQAGQEHSGEWPIHPKKLTRLPRDAAIILEIRKAARVYLAKHPEINNPVADLIAEEAVTKEHPWLRRLQSSVTQPIAFSLPSPVLRVLLIFHGEPFIGKPEDFIFS